MRLVERSLREGRKVVRCHINISSESQVSLFGNILTEIRVGFRIATAERTPR